jgi:hypothetical protein
MRTRTIMIMLALLAGGGAATYLGTKGKPTSQDCGRFEFVDGVVQPLLTDAQLQTEAMAMGVEAERVYYAEPAPNAKGEIQLRYLNLLRPTVRPRGVCFYFHGGGGDVGSADARDILAIGAGLAKEGWYFASIEYRRGWTGNEPLDQWCSPGRDPHNETEEAFARQRESALMSFLDAETGARAAYEIARKETGEILPSFATGTSFGGACASHLGYGLPNFYRDVNLWGVLNQFGGLSQQDPLFANVPYMGVGGVADDLVPFYNGPSFVNENGELLWGCGGLGWKLREMGIPTRITATCEAGHGRGATTEQGIIKAFLDWIQDPDPRQTDFIIETDGPVGVAYTDSCYYSIEQLRARRKLLGL